MRAPYAPSADGVRRPPLSPPPSRTQESGYFDKWLHCVGLVVFILGLLAYAYCQHQAKKAKAAAAAAAPKADVEKGGRGKPTEASPLNVPLVAAEADGNKCVIS